MKTQKIVVVLALALGFATAVQAEEYWASANVGGTTSGNTNPFAGSCLNIWTNAQGETAAELDVVNFAGTDILHVQNGYTLTLGMSSTFTGAFHAGATDGSSSATLNPRSDTLTLDNLLWHSATLTMNRSSRFPILAGNAALDCPNATHKIGAMSSSLCGICLASNLSCSDDDLSVTIETTVSGTGDRCIVIAGNNAGYEGNFKQLTAQTPLVVAHANALGNPSVGKSDALSIDAANAVFSVVKGVTLNSARGISINQTGFCICAANYSGFHSGANSYKDCTEFELAMPITGSYGFTKDGDGTVTLSGDYTAGDIAIENGTLVITSSAEFPAGQNISVASGAALYVHQPLSRFNITAAEDATVEYVLDTFEVTYDDSEHTATALTRGSSFSVPEGVKQPIALLPAISLPLHTALHLEVLTVASGADALSADDFTDETPKTFGLPKTSFEVTTDGAGVQHVYLNVSPVVVSDGDFSSGTDNNQFNNTSANWSNDEVAQAGYDYLITNGVSRIPSVAFVGESLTIANSGGTLREVNSRASGTLDATIYPGTKGIRIVQSSSNGHGLFTISGNLCIAGDYDDDVYTEFAAKYGVDDGYSNCWHRLSANLSGKGPLMMTSVTKNGPKGSPQLYGDNSAFKGRIYVTYSGTGSGPGNAIEEWNHVAMEFNSANALGGALDTFKYDSLTLDKYSVLRPAESIDFSTENRGIYGSGPFGFDVTNGITFKVGVPVKMDDIMFKHGEGDLILGGEISYGGSSTKTCYVREGGIGALDDAAVAGLNVVFSNGTKIVVAPGATLANGFAGVSFEPSDATVTVGFASDFTPPANGEAFTVAIATVPTSEGDLSSHFALEGGLRGYTGTIVTESVVVDDVPCTRYIARYAHNGMIIIFR